MRNFLHRHRWVALALTALLAIIIVSRIPVGSASIARIAIADQVTALAASSAPVTSLTAQQIADSDLLTANGTVPVTVLPSTDLAAALADGTASTAVMNTARNLAVVAVDPTGQRIRILAAYYLPSQEDAIRTALTAVGADITVQNPAGAAVAYGSRGASAPAQGSAASTGMSITGWILLILVGLIMIGLVIRVTHQLRARAAGKAALTGQADVPDTTFADIAGCDEAIEEMTELVDFLREPERFTRAGAVAPRGALLVGPPGTGKTLLARAVAGEAGVPFYSVAGSDFVEIYVGQGPKRVRELFATARKHPEGAIIFIDEIDAVGRARSSSASSSAANSEGESTLNALLVEMDGFTQSRVIVLAATNRDDILDAALTRPGRLDRKVHVGLPDRLGRERILAVHAKGRPFAPATDWPLIARRTPGMSGADLAQLVNEACMVAARDRRDTVTDIDLDDAIAIVTMGRARTSAIVSEQDRLLTAWHEAGHAISGLVQPDAPSPVSISIVPRGHAGGVTHFPGSDGAYLTRRAAYAQLVTAMGGMAAEQMFLGNGEFTTGPSSDLQQGSQLALNMVTRFGMGERLLVKSDAILGAAGMSTDEAVSEADALLRRALADASVLLRKNRKLFDAMIAALLEWETLTNEQILDLVKGVTIVSPSSPPPAPRRTSGSPRRVGLNSPARPARASEAELIPALADLVNAVTRKLAPRRRSRKARGA